MGATLQDINLQREYLSLDKAAAILNVDTEDLLHAGAIGMAQICVRCGLALDGVDSLKSWAFNRKPIDTDPVFYQPCSICDSENALDEDQKDGGRCFFIHADEAYKQWVDRAWDPLPDGLAVVPRDFLTILESRRHSTIVLTHFFINRKVDVLLIYDVDEKSILHKEDLIITVSEVNRLKSRIVGAIEKPMTTRERNTLLTIIAALCKEAKIDYAKPAKAAGMILSTVEKMGASIGERTIEEHLKKIPDALGTRMK